MSGGPGLTLVEKIATRHTDSPAPGAVVRSGDFVTIRPRHVMTHDNTAAVIPKFREIARRAGIERPRIHDPRQPVVAIDHDIQNRSAENLGKYAKIEAFAHENGLDFYPAGTGIAHQLMVDEGYVVPGALVVGSDSHSNIYGALAALGTPVVRTDAASIWATGTTWWQVPPIARVTLRGRLRPGVTGKDVIITLCGTFRSDEVLNHAVEFVDGPEGGIAAMPMDQRLSIANMTTEWGALAGLFPYDETLHEFLLARARRPGADRRAPTAAMERLWTTRASIAPDPDAQYAVELELDLSTVVPHVAGPNTVKAIVPLPEIEPKRVAIQKAWLLSCVNGRFEDLAEAARVVSGKRVAEGVTFYVAAASADIQSRAEEAGHWATLLSAGAQPLPPGCGTCIGLGVGTIQAGETGISATNRNFEGRMGHRDGLVYLASPAVVAASAVRGYIASPTTFETAAPSSASRRAAGRSSPSTSVEIVHGFSAEVAGRLLWLDRDDLNTDGIYAGKHTYSELAPERMAEVIFENYDPHFRDTARSGDVVVGGLNFGTGSSREQAATALKHFGVPCVIAASFSETYKRNAFNNGFVVFECPELVAHLRRRFSPRAAATALAGDVTVDYLRSEVRFDGQRFPFPALSPVAQELVVAGGAEALVASRLRSTSSVSS